jgi:hypothetical protein
MQSLLGQFYSRIKGSQEDIASEGLVYVLQRSASARAAISRIVRGDIGLDLGELTYSCQNVGEKLERPDISGRDAEGTEVLIMEAKFWASLTDGQPNAYLSRLNESSALVFVCPTLRVRTIFVELLNRMKGHGAIVSVDEQGHIIRLENNKCVVVKTWSEILGTIRLQLVQDNDQVLISDIDQIIGLCDTIDSNAFQPLRSEDLSPFHAMRMNGFLDIADKVLDELKKQGLADTKGLNSAAQKGIYTRYLRSGNLGCALYVRTDLWAEGGDTPFWFIIKDATVPTRWTVSPKFKSACINVCARLGLTTYESRSRELYIALYPALDSMEDAVISELCGQISQLLRALEAELTIE